MKNPETPDAAGPSDDDKSGIEMLTRMVSLWSRKSETCPHCGAHVEAMVEIGRCVYSRPCGCRQYQGKLDAAWKARPSSEE